ncbi:Reversal of tor2 lethality [Orbilia ellipsospora]|uniref:Protein ROT1 n=1 Tax=Orbilia ellipsospora TaxID=2528407 RepID=A0AAV9X0W6_9PEZI
MRTELAAALLLFGSSTIAGNVTALQGTWTSKSDTVVTGPAFYDPVGEKFLEPRLPGTAFSFTNDGYFEESIYTVVGNPTNPECPTALIIWQHGKYTLYSNGSLVLFPYASDGRKLWSDPCTSQTSVYTRYNQTELYKSWEIVLDAYRGQYRLNLFRFDGSPMNPLYLTYNPPQMLPTTTLNPVTTTTATGTVTPTTASKIKRSLMEIQASLPEATANLDFWWYIAVGMTIIGGFGWYFV